MHAGEQKPFNSITQDSETSAYLSPRVICPDSKGEICRVAEDLVEVFFQIVHSRWPMLSPDDFRRRLNLRGDSDLHDLLPSPISSSGSLPGTTDPHPSTNGSSNGTSNALHPAIVATVLAWGAKFTEHSLFLADRAMNGGQGLFAKTIIERARAVAEVMKVQRVATPEHVIVGLLLEPVQPREYHNGT